MADKELNAGETVLMGLMFGVWITLPSTEEGSYLAMMLGGLTIALLLLAFCHLTARTLDFFSGRARQLLFLGGIFLGSSVLTPGAGYLFGDPADWQQLKRIFFSWAGFSTASLIWFYACSLLRRIRTKVHA
ncbi:hypothetical protein HY406_00780 [Candidatus Giovannonibacteria bacterium]|nr:hypothetical protein [Candidatus Giovannonibacteria bacterium]